ncbi:MAG: hypothetical protein LBD75_04665 [Candidatus Peribacteria bacterium]|nr:hypothetical protein [Candidatus Peribacteria bacterium]
MSKVFAGHTNNHLALYSEIPIKKLSFFYLLFFSSMVIKRTNKPTAKNPAPQAVQSVKKPTPPTVVARTTKPKVVIQTKRLSDQLPSAYTLAPEPCCGHKCHKGKWIWKVLLLLVLLANLGLAYCTYKMICEQQQFVINSNGGQENYNMLKDIYATPEFQQASTLSVYQLMERVEQTLTAASQQPAEGVVPQYVQ